MKKFLITDRNLHMVLIAAIIILVITALYFRFFSQTIDQYEELVRSRISKFDLEHALQEKAEEIKPGSVKVPILTYHSVRPHHLNQSPLQHYYEIAPEVFGLGG